MPTFNEGQDPLDTPGINPMGRMPTGTPEPKPFSDPSAHDVLGAAFRQGNPIVSALDALTRSRPDSTPVPGYNPVKRLSGTKDDDLIEQSLADVNPAQTDARIAKKNAEIKDRQTLAASGWFGTVAEIAAGATDPSWFIPIAGELRAAGKGASLVAGIGRGMGEGALKSAVSEAALQSSQATRTPGESAANIATNTLLMGLIGGGMAMLSPAERTAARDGLESIRKDLSPPGAVDRAVDRTMETIRQMDLPLHDETSIVPHEAPEPVTLASDLSAASSDARTMKLSRILLPENMMHALKQVPVLGSAIDYTSRVLMGFSPTLRVFSSGSLIAKRALGDLAETSLRFTQADQGITTARGGIPIDRLVKMQAHDGQLTNSQILRDNFIKYRGLEDSKLPTAQATIQDVRGQAPGKLSFDDFKTAVSGAMTDGDVHAIPEAATAAKQIRAQVLDPVTRLAQRTMGPDGKPMLADALEPPKGDKSFFPRVWNKQAIAAKYNEAKRTFADWLEGEQGTKAAAKERLVAFNGALQAHELNIAKIEARLSGRTDALEGLQDKAEEITRLNKFAFQRAETLRTRSTDSDPIPQQFKNIKLNTPSGKTDVTGLWFLDGDKPVYAQATPEGARGTLGDRAKDLEKYGSLSGQDDKGNPITVWFKPGEEDRAKRVLEIFASKDKTGTRSQQINYHTENGRALGYSNASVRAYVQKRFDLPKNYIENARGGAVFETKIRQRGNVLADQASGKTAEIGTLEEQLIRETDSATAMRAKIEKEIADWQGNTTVEAKAALKTREAADALRAQKMAEGTYEGAGERLTGADSAVDRAVKAIIKSDRDLSRSELESRAAEIINRINTAPDGRLPYDIASGGPAMGPPGEHQQVRGSLNARDFAIPTSLVKDFVNTDTEHVIASHLRTALPDIHLTDRFGDVEMTQVFKNLNDEYDAKLASAGSAKEQTRLDAEKKAMVRDLAATRDRVRGIYGFELAKAQPNAARIANAARNFNLITDLGTSVFNRMTDATNAVWRHGLMNVFGDGYIPFFKSMVGMGDGFATAARQSMKDMGVGIDSAIGHLSHQWGDVIDNSMPGSKFERALAWSADKSMMVNLHGPWTDGMKTIAGTVAGAEFLRAAERFAAGSQTAKDIEQMTMAGIGAPMATRIWKAYSNGGGQEFGKGTHVANTADWTDAQARDVFSSAVARSADQAVLTPGMEKPLWMSGPVVSLLGQYKSFVAAAHEKVLISNLQQMDGRTLQGLVASLGMGMISYRAYTLWSGGPTSERPQDWIKEGISRSAMLGWLTELNSMQAKFSGGTTDMFRAIGADHPLSRRQTNGALSELLGPTYSKLEGISGGVNDAFHGTWTAMDTHKLRQALFLQNLFAVRRLLDSAEDGFNEHMGVKPLNRDPSLWPGSPPH